MGDIAAVVGITPPALYRHFAGKQQLLGQVLIGSVEVTVDRLRAVHDQGGTVRDLLDGLFTVAADRRGLPALWRREARNLDVDDARALLARVGELSALVRDSVGAARPGLGEQHRAVLSWCVLSVVVSAAEFDGKLPRDALAGWADTLVRLMFAADLPPSGPPHDTAPATPAHPVGLDHADRPLRRELLLAAATRLFNERGYAGVGIEDIGAAVGLAGPSVYHHFASKEELLAEIFERNEQAVLAHIARAIVQESTAEGFLRRLLRSYITLVMDNPDAIGVTASDIDSLDPEHAARARKVYRDAVGRWSRALRATAPHLSDEEARLVVHVVVTAVNDTVRNPRLLRVPGLADMLLAVGTAMTLPGGGFPQR